MISTNENLIIWKQRIKERTKSVKTGRPKNGISKHKYNYYCGNDFLELLKELVK